MPNILQKGWHYLQDLARWELAGKPVVTKEVREARWNKCLPCPDRNRDNNSCKWCGCSLSASFLGDMLGWATSFCRKKDKQGNPAPEWEATFVPSDGLLAKAEAIVKESLNRQSGALVLPDGPVTQILTGDSPQSFRLKEPENGDTIITNARCRWNAVTGVDIAVDWEHLKKVALPCRVAVGLDWRDIPAKISFAMLDRKAGKLQFGPSWTEDAAGF